MLPVVDMYDIHGGSLWGNKCDQILSYHRPRFHEDKNSPEVEVYIQKVKRKRTGGKLGHFPLTLIWNKKRFAEDTSNRIPCDPIMAAKEIKRKNNDYRQDDMWKPYKDNDGNEPEF
jgi:hypothetical protein